MPVRTLALGFRTASVTLRHSGDSGNEKIFAFCPACGSPAYLTFVATPDLIAVRRQVEFRWAQHEEYKRCGSELASASGQSSRYCATYRRPHRIDMWHSWEKAERQNALRQPLVLLFPRRKRPADGIASQQPAID